MQKRLPKFGFTSRIGITTAEIRTSELGSIAGDVVTVEALKDAGLVAKNITRAKVFLSGDVTRAVTVKGLKVSKGAKEAIETAGGKVED
jgi:large subunit ribosomal protein L15